MTTKELIKHLKSCGFIVSEDEDMIHAKKGKQTVNCDKTIQPDSLWTYVLSLLTEYNQTPLDERYPEKKYRLRWVNNNDGTSNYLDYLAGEWRLFANEDVHIFMETELQQLKINNPRFVPVIDAMKELVEDE